MERLWLPEAESRLTLLYMLNRLGPVTRQQLETFGLRFSMLNFFDLQTNLISLLEQGLVREEPGPLGHGWCSHRRERRRWPVFRPAFPRRGGRRWMRKRRNGGTASGRSRRHPPSG